MTTYDTVPGAAILPLLSKPSSQSLRTLRGVLYEQGITPRAPLARTLAHFHAFLLAIESAVTVQHFAEVASLLDIAAVGAVALQNLVEADMAAPDFWKRALLGAASETMVVLASRQYVKGARSELERIIEDSSWRAYDSLWELPTVEGNPVTGPERRLKVDRLLAPVHDRSQEPLLRVILLARIYQSVLFIHLGSGLAAGGSNA